MPSPQLPVGVFDVGCEVAAEHGGPGPVGALMFVLQVDVVHHQHYGRRRGAVSEPGLPARRSEAGSIQVLAVSVR